MDFEIHKASLLAFYVNLAQQDGFKAYTWHRVQQLSRDCPSLYADFPQLLTAAMTSQTPASNPSTSPP